MDKIRIANGFKVVFQILACVIMSILATLIAWMVIFKDPYISAVCMVGVIGLLYLLLLCLNFVGQCDSDSKIEKLIKEVKELKRK